MTEPATKLNPLETIAYWLLMGFSKLVGLLPFVVLYYLIAPLIYFVVYRILRYRVGVVRANLRNSFPDKSRHELRRIERLFYLHLAELFVDVIDMTSMTPAALIRRMRIEGIEEFDRRTEGRSWIAALSHYGEWEFFASYACTHRQYHNLGVYHPLKNEVMDRFYLHLRHRFGLEPVSVKGLARKVLEYDKTAERFTIGLIADQNTYRSHSDGKWRTFLNQPTLFFGGMGHYAKRFGIPVWFLHIDRRYAAHYSVYFEQIYDGTEDIDEQEITSRYAAALEKMITARPELWLWSHRRWKTKPPKDYVAD